VKPPVVAFLVVPLFHCSSTLSEPLTSLILLFFSVPPQGGKGERAEQTAVSMEDFEDFDEEYEDFLRYRAEKQSMNPSGLTPKQKQERTALVKKHANDNAENLLKLMKNETEAPPGKPLRAALQQLLKDKHGYTDDYFRNEAAAKKAQAGAAAEDATPGAAAAKPSPSNVKKGAVAPTQQKNENNSNDNQQVSLSETTIEKFMYLKDKKLPNYVRKSLTRVVHKAYLFLMPMASDTTAKDLRKAAKDIKESLDQLKEKIGKTSGDAQKDARAEYKKLKERWDNTMVRARRTKVKVPETEKTENMRIRAMPTEQMENGKWKYERFYTTESCVPSSSSIEHFAARIADLGIDLSSE
jgi:hypothetical protein